MYLQHHGSPQRTEKTKSILFYALSVVYTLSATTIITDILVFSWPGAVSMNYHCCFNFFQLVVQNIEIVYHLQIMQAISFACCDFIAQSVLVRKIWQCLSICLTHLILQKIFRCWIVWGRNIHVVILPSILAFAFLGPSIHL